MAEPKVIVKMIADVDDLNYVSEAGGIGKNVEHALELCGENPELLATVFSNMLKAKKPLPNNKTRATSIFINLKSLNTLERLADRVVMTRNALVQLILKGIVSGVLK